MPSPRSPPTAGTGGSITTPIPRLPTRSSRKWGGFLPDIPFDPIRYGMPPSSLPSIEPAQLIALEVVRTALADAGYAERPFPREQTSVVLGMGGGAAQLAMGFAFRSYLPMLDTVLPEAGRQAMQSCQGLLPEWTEDSFPGFLLNVTAGRIANRLNLGGSNYTVDAACGSSLAAAALGRPRARSQARPTWSSWAASTPSRTPSPTWRSARPRRSRRAAAAAHSTRVRMESSSVREWPRSCSSGWPTPSATATASTQSSRASALRATAAPAA